MFADTAAPGAGTNHARPDTDVTLRKPDSEDGAKLHALVKRCKPLVAAELDGELVGFVSAYIPPKQQNTLFVWQVAVDEKARGLGLASRMLAELLDRDESQSVQYIDTTITPDNDASWALFRRFADKRRYRTETFILFDSRIHFSGAHKDEHLLRIGPFNRTQVNDALNH
jgi:L-2,4-diaminobutyric acid acetyltransferase